MDVFTLFAANAIVLAVMASGFFAAWRKQPDESYWRSWIFANLTLMTALLLFMFFPTEAGQINTIPHCLLILGFGLRWRAACQFTRARDGGMSAVGLPMCATILLFAFPALFSPGFVYSAVNIVLMLQTAAIAWCYWREERAKSSSSYGLIAAYSVMSFSFGSRVAQGLVFLDEFTSYLPHDLMLQIHLLAALIHTSASGAFVLSIAYERAAAQLHSAALRDPLTGLPNRRAFNAHVTELLSEHQGEKFSIIIFDLDHFKAVNDRYGHATGDAALRDCARIFAEAVQEPNFIARIGGEEFVAIVADRSPKQAFALAEYVRNRVSAQDILTKEGRIELSLSAGMSEGNIGERDFDTILREADANLYRAKQAGRNRVERSSEIGQIASFSAEPKLAEVPCPIDLRSAAL